MKGRLTLLDDFAVLSFERDLRMDEVQHLRDAMHEWWKKGRRHTLVFGSAEIIVDDQRTKKR